MQIAKKYVVGRPSHKYSGRIYVLVVVVHLTLALKFGSWKQEVEVIFFFKEKVDKIIKK